MLFFRGLLFIATLVWGLVFLERLFTYERRYDQATSRATREAINERRTQMLRRTIVIGVVLIVPWLILELAT